MSTIYSFSKPTDNSLNHKTMYLSNKINFIGLSLKTLSFFENFPNNDYFSDNVLVILVIQNVDWDVLLFANQDQLINNTY